MNNNSEKKQHWIKLVINELSHHSISIIFMIVLFLMLWVVPQINDLIAVLGQDQTIIRRGRSFASRCRSSWYIAQPTRSAFSSSKSYPCT